LGKIINMSPEKLSSHAEEEPEKISSLHDDPLVPKATEHLGEYSDYPNRFDPKDKSVLTRLEQFGVDLKTAEKTFSKDIKDFTWEDYTELMAGAIKARYDVVVASVFDQYMFPNPENPENATRWDKMLKLIDRYKDMGERCGVHIVKRAADFKESGNLVLGLEAGAHLIHSLTDVEKLADHGVKFFGFQYNKPTPLADEGGLTELGRTSALYMLDHGLVIDLAHSNYKTRQDVISLAKDGGKGHLVSYSHGCAEEDVMDSWKGKMGERALKDEEISQIVKIGGIIGLGVTKPFFSSTRKVAERINEIAQLKGGIEAVAIGTDFGGVPPAFLNEIRNPEGFKILADTLSEDFNIKDEDVNKVLRKNAKEWIKRAVE